MIRLRQVLADSFQPRPVTPDIRLRRQRLCQFIRRNEAHMYDVRHPRAATVRTLLGWDDATMATFVDSPLLCHSAPHVSMNSFPPMLAYGWVLASAVRLAQEQQGAPAVHVCTHCTHHNFDDRFSKPYAWWHSSPVSRRRPATTGPEVIRTQVFKRTPIRHHPILSKPAPRLADEPMHLIDRNAIELAALGTNYANYCVIYRTYLERLAGFHVDERVIEVPMDMVNRFTIEEFGLVKWFDLIDRAGMNLRLELENGPLAVMSRAEAQMIAKTGEPWLKRAVIAPNTVNFSQFYLLGLSLMIGGSKMAHYVAGMNVEIERFVAGIAGWRYTPPTFLPFTTVPVAEVLDLQDQAAYCQEKYGFSTSLPLVAVALGPEAGSGLDALLTFDYRVLGGDSVAR